LPSDYSRAGAYDIAVCTYRREPLFGEVAEGTMIPSASGQIVRACWDDLPNHYAHVALDAFEIMLNHVHGIIVLSDGRMDVAGAEPVEVGPVAACPVTTDAMAAGPVAADAMGVGPVAAGLRPAATEKRHAIPEIVRALKSFSSRRINELRGTLGRPTWQRGFHERIIRCERDLSHIRNYIAENPSCWNSDRRYRPQHLAHRG
jgi:REP element-mobilizing transposase RayT